MGESCSTHGRDDNFIQYFGRKTCKGREYSEDVGVHWRIILEWNGR